MRAAPTLATEKLDDKGLHGLLRRVDPTFQPLAGGPFRAANDKGFMVELIAPERDLRDSAPVTFGPEDLIATKVPNLHWLVNARKQETVVICTDGRPALMRVPDPRAFALHKAWLSRRADREPVKKGRDRAQSVLVADLLLADLPGMPFDPGRLRYFSADMLATARRTIEAIPTSSSPPGVLNLPARASRGAYLRAHNTGKPPPAQRPRGGRSTLAVGGTGTPE